MKMLQIKTSLRAGYAQMQASAQTFRRERLMPLVNETQEFVEDVREGYVQTRNTIHTVGHETLPVWWNTTRRESHAAMQTMQEELTLSVTTPLKQCVRSVTTQVRDAFHQVGPLLDEVYEVGEGWVQEHVIPWEEDTRRQQLANLLSADTSLERSPEERQMNRKFTLALITLVCNTIAVFVYPPLLWVSLPALLYNSVLDAARGLLRSDEAA